jgi:hypothetical protein
VIAAGKALPHPHTGLIHFVASAMSKATVTANGNVTAIASTRY